MTDYIKRKKVISTSQKAMRETLTVKARHSLYPLSAYIANSEELKQTWISGLKALPDVNNLPKCFTVLQFDRLPNREEIEARYRQLCKSAHPDVGGSDAMFQRLTEAKDAALAFIEKEGER